MQRPKRDRIAVVLFDLDGTLIDPAGGITGGIAHALAASGLPVPDQTTLQAMVGPKLSDALLAYTSAAHKQIPEITDTYRSWYAETGMAMGRVYEGIVDVLDTLVDEGIKLGVATQKPQSLARTILQAHGLAVYFDVIAGAPDDDSLRPGDAGYVAGKAEIIANALSTLGGGSAVMVGDRAQDVEGARANGIACIGAAWGLAAPGELAEAGAATIAVDARDLLGELLEADAWKKREHQRYTGSTST